MDKNFFWTPEHDLSEDDSVQLERKQKKNRSADQHDPEVQGRAKRLDPYNKKAKSILQRLQIKDYKEILNELTSLLNDIDKNSKQLEVDGLPASFFFVVEKISGHCEGITSKDKERMSKDSKSAMTKLKQRVKKVNEEMAAEFEKYRASPITSVDQIQVAEESEEEESEDLTEFESVEESADESESKKSEAEGEDDASEWDQEPDDGVATPPMRTEDMPREERRKRWLRPVPLSQLKKEADQNKNLKDDGHGRTQKREQGRGIEKVYRIIELNQDFSGVSLTDDSVHRRLVEIGTNINSYSPEKQLQNIGLLTYILNNLEEDKRRLEVIILLVYLKNEYNRAQNLMITTDQWTEACRFVQEYLQILISGKPYLDAKVRSYLKNEDGYYEKKELENYFRSMVSSLDNDWNNLIKNCDPESVEYSVLLTEEVKLIKIIKECLDYFLAIQNVGSAAFIAAILVEHLYFINDETIKRISVTIEDHILTKEEPRYVAKLCKHVYNKATDSSLTVKIALFESFNHSINDRYLLAKDLLLMFNQADRSANDERLGVLFNRALTALGLCAFRLGKINECQQILEDLCNSGKLKELLSQSSLKGYGEVESRRPLIPYHLSLPTEHIETAYYISVMLIECPILAAQLSDNEKRSSCKLFQRLWQHYEKNPLSGPPENHRDLVYCATKELLKGEWRNCYNLICQLKIWSKVGNLEEVKALYLTQIKHQAYKTFIANLRNSHHVLKFDRIEQIFGIPASTLLLLTCEMIYNGDLQAKLDPRSGSLVTGKKEQNEFTNVAERLNQRAYSMMNLNEKLFDVKLADLNFSEQILLSDNIQNRPVKKTKTGLRIFSN